MSWISSEVLQVSHNLKLVQGLVTDTIVPKRNTKNTKNIKKWSAGLTVQQAY